MMHDESRIPAPLGRGNVTPLTNEQLTVVAHDIKPGEVLKVNAFAGTGKTTTAVAYSARRPNKTLYLAFNKSVEMEAKRKFSAQFHVTAKTAHALAYAAVGRHYGPLGNISLFGTKIRLKMRNIYDAALVTGTLENWLNSAEETIGPEHCAPDAKGRHEGEPNFKENLVKGAEVIWGLMCDRDKYFPMSHSGYLKLYQLTKPMLTNDLLVLDEAQDSNPVTLDIVKRQRENGTRILLIGDAFQQIYSWRGAQDAMSSVEAPTLYLTESFRFGPGIAEVANIVLESFFDAKEKLKAVGREDQVLRSASTMPGRYTYITRSNAEIFHNSLALAKSKARISLDVGKFDVFLDQLIDIHHLDNGALDSIKERRFAKFGTFADLKEYAEAVGDRDLLCKIELVEEHGKAIPGLVTTIRTASVAEADADVCLITAHKSKGLEWDNVVLANDFDDLFNDNGERLSVRTVTTSPLQKAIVKDEVNLYYVAATRARKKLVLNSDLVQLMDWHKSSERPVARMAHLVHKINRLPRDDEADDDDY